MMYIAANFMDISRHNQRLIHLSLVKSTILNRHFRANPTLLVGLDDNFTKIYSYQHAIHIGVETMRALGTGALAPMFSVIIIT